MCFICSYKKKINVCLFISIIFNLNNWLFYLYFKNYYFFIVYCVERIDVMIMLININFF